MRRCARIRHVQEMIGRNQRSVRGNQFAPRNKDILYYNMALSGCLTWSVQEATLFKGQLGNDRSAILIGEVDARPRCVAWLRFGRAPKLSWHPGREFPSEFLRHAGQSGTH